MPGNLAIRSARWVATPTGVVAETGARHLATDGDQRGRAERELVRAQQRGYDHVAAALEAAVDADPHPPAKTVGQQRMLRLGQAQLPRAAPVDAAQRRRTGAAVGAAQVDQVGMAFSHARCYGADTRFGDKLDRDVCLGVDLLEIEDQLGQILDAVDIVVRRRGDQCDAWRAVAEPGDLGCDLVPRQLAALARLGALRHLICSSWADIK